MGRKLITHIKRLDHYAIYVQDLENSIVFYRDIMGFPEKKRPNFDFPGAWFDLGNDQELHLIQGEGKVMSNNRSLHFAFEVDDFETIFEICKEHHLFYEEPKKRPDGPLQLFIRDNSGYFIEFTLKIFDESIEQI